MSTSRFPGSFTIEGAPADVFGAAAAAAPAEVPTPPPAPVAPAGSPAPVVVPQPQPGQVEQFQTQPQSHPVRNAIIGIVLVVGILVAGWKGIPWVMSMFGNNDTHQTDPNAGQGGQSTPAPSGSQTTDDGQTNNGTNDGDQSTAQTMAQKAALLDPWFDGVPESHWESKTSADLGVTTSTPLGQFCAKFCVVLDDGQVIARGTSETGESIPTVITDYVVPTEWYNKAILVDEQKIDLVLVISKVPTDRNQEVTGQIWTWSNELNGYSWSGPGSSTPYAE